MADGPARLRLLPAAGCGSRQCRLWHRIRYLESRLHVSYRNRIINTSGLQLTARSLCEMVTGSVLFQATEGTHLIDTITSTLRLPESKQEALRAFVGHLLYTVSMHARLCRSRGHAKRPAFLLDKLESGAISSRRDAPKTVSEERIQSADWQ